MDEKVQAKVNEFFFKYPLRKFEKGHMIIHAGSDPDGIIYLVDGIIRQYDITDSGSEIVVNVFKTPAFFPMSWAVSDVKNQYFYDASTDVSIRQAPPKEVLEFLNNNSDVMQDLLKRVYSGTHGMQRRMAHLMGGTSQSRLLFELVIECERFGENVKNDVYTIKITEDELANRAGLSRETISRMIKKLKEKDLITIQHGTITVHNLTELKLRLGSDL